MGRTLLLLALFLTGAGLRAEDSACPYTNWDLEERVFADRLGALAGKDKAPLAELERQLVAEPRFAMEFIAPSGPRPETPAALYRKCRPAVVAVGSAYKCARCPHWHVNTASGFVVRPDGVIATNYHVVEQEDNARMLGVRLQDGTVFPITAVLAGDKRNDAALVKIDAQDLPALPLARDVEIGDEVFVISHPVGALYTFTHGLVSNKFLRRGRDREWPEFTITADFAKGSSGGPILNRDGAVAGMVRATNSIYYDRRGEVDTNLQMVWKQCVPAVSIRDLAEPRDARNKPEK